MGDSQSEWTERPRDNRLFVRLAAKCGCGGRVGLTEPTPRQVLYGLVAGLFVAVVVVLVVGSAAAGFTPAWWTMVMGVLSIVVIATLILRWRQTALALSLSIGLFLVWAVGTLMVS